jgi:hypothetical protein
MKVGAELDRIGGVMRLAYELDIKMDHYFRYRKTWNKFVALFCHLCLLSTGNSFYRADALPTTNPYHSLVN